MALRFKPCRCPLTIRPQRYLRRSRECGILVGIGNRSPDREPLGILSFNIQMESLGEGYVNPGKSSYVCLVYES